MLTTTNLLAVIVLLSTSLVAYLAGLRAGRDEGYQKGRDDGKKESAGKAFAVGYDRGKRERPEPEESAAKPRSVWLWLIGITTLVLLGVLEAIM